MPLRLYDRATRTHVVVSDAKVYADLNGDGRIGRSEECQTERRQVLLDAARHITTLFESRVCGISSPDDSVVSGGELNAVERREFESPAGTPARRNLLHEHLTFFDRGNTGRIGLGQNYESWRLLGFSVLKAVKLTIGSVAVFGGRPQNGFSIDLAGINNWRPAGSTGIYDKDGNIDEPRFDEFCSAFEAAAVDGVLDQEQARTIVHAKARLGTVPRRQFESLFAVAEHMNHSKTITVDQIRWLYDGTLLWRAASMANRRGRRAL